MSTPHQRLQELLSALGGHIGIGALALNQDNVCRLVLDKTLVIDIEHLPDTDTLQVYAVVGGHPGDNAAICCRMLAANLFGQGTGGAVLALDEQRGETLLVHAFDLASVTPQKFVATLDAFVGYVEAWTAELRDADEEDDGEDGGDSNVRSSSSAAGASGFIRV